MTDTDKLKRLAEAEASWGIGIYRNRKQASDAGEFRSLDLPQVILALIAENERLKAALVAITEADDGYQRIARRAL